MAMNREREAREAAMRKRRSDAMRREESARREAMASSSSSWLATDLDPAGRWHAQLEAERGAARRHWEARMKELRPGQVVALAARSSGSNGCFMCGDIGEASFGANGSVEILWPNGTVTRTAWPNGSWYLGTPVAYTAQEVASSAEISTSCDQSWAPTDTDATETSETLTAGWCDAPEADASATSAGWRDEDALTMETTPTEADASFTTACWCEEELATTDTAAGEADAWEAAAVRCDEEAAWESIADQCKEEVVTIHAVDISVK
eukprot:gnl/TRDRNA2_/TRDRNA2_82189_c0_seq1.p2 gnl/TRDRNA2_/TRDRNA2_82189_c0~~gnl/TRDRNA2_/TRDRNA2_82189_c0_seq1.p2  ORF type:complete len:275 (+),score=54.04 gnl/TRDRNA2_/TRDRNA2_82189_c0_seq1:31-825(+)